MFIEELRGAEFLGKGTPKTIGKAPIPNTGKNTFAETTVVGVTPLPLPAAATVTVRTGVVEASVVQVPTSDPR